MKKPGKAILEQEAKQPEEKSNKGDMPAVYASAKKAKPPEEPGRKTTAHPETGLRQANAGDNDDDNDPSGNHGGGEGFGGMDGGYSEPDEGDNGGKL